MKQTTVIKAPCETCLRNKKKSCFSAAALIKTARSMEMDLYNHGVENLVAGFTLPCSNYVSESELLKVQYKKIV